MSIAAQHVKRATFKKGEVVFHEGDARDLAYIIEDGEIDIIRGHGTPAEHCYATLKKGELFGEMALMEPGFRSASAIAKTNVVVFIISPAALEDRLSGVDPVVVSLFSILIERYRFSRIESDIALDEVFGRLRPESAESFSESLKGHEARKETALRELALEQEIRRALDNGDFHPYLQPIVSLKDQKIIGFETLIRWHHPDKGIIMPDEFIPVAERMNLIQAIDRHMLEMACEILPTMHKIIQESPKPFISINLSGINFDDASMVAGVSEVLKNSNIDPAHIKLEITESAFIGNADKAAKILEGLRNLGVTISLDDFGVGYSSLGYLHKFAIDGIKIDRSFTKRARDNKKSQDMIQAIVGLANTFELDVIAEGIETQADLDYLVQIGCCEGQGFLFGKPLSVEEALVKLAS
jgi:EAL domain-containing protein (putative c-di-GMP-specific phosphodiesterase class I)